MFSYKTPEFKFRISIKSFSIILSIIYILGLIPMLVLGFYNWPSADDYSMALLTHQSYVSDGSIINAILASLEKSYYIYTNYEGYFFSIILTCICPSAFSEKLYFIVPFIILGMLTYGVCYFFDALFVRVWKIDCHLTNIVSMITLIMLTQCLNGENTRVEAFYWYSGAINYTFTFAMAFFWLGLLIRSVYDDSARSRKKKFIGAIFWGFMMGGANYMTALELAICSVLILFIYVMVRFRKFSISGASEDQLKSFGYIWIPVVINLVGFSFSCFGPGNSNRIAETTHNGPVKAVLLALYSVHDIMLNSMTRWEMIVAFLILIPIFWKMAGGLKHKFEHPILFTAFSYLLVASNVTPPFYAVANIEAGRIKALSYFEFVIMMVLTIFYITAYIRQNSEIKSDVDNLFSRLSSMFIILLAGLIVIGSGLSVVPEHDYYCATSALSNILSGNAAIYRNENLERLQILKDDSIKSAGLLEHTSQPDMLFFGDITPNSGEWINTATATYYDKDEVYLINID